MADPQEPVGCSVRCLGNAKTSKPALACINAALREVEFSRSSKAMGDAINTMLEKKQLAERFSVILFKDIERLQDFKWSLYEFNSYSQWAVNGGSALIVEDFRTRATASAPPQVSPHLTQPQQVPDHIASHALNSMTSELEAAKNEIETLKKQLAEKDTELNSLNEELLFSRERENLLQEQKDSVETEYCEFVASREEQDLLHEEEVAELKNQCTVLEQGKLFAESTIATQGGEELNRNAILLDEFKLGQQQELFGTVLNTKSNNMTQNLISYFHKHFQFAQRSEEILRQELIQEQIKAFFEIAFEQEWEYRGLDQDIINALNHVKMFSDAWFDKKQLILQQQHRSKSEQLEPVSHTTASDSDTKKNIQQSNNLQLEKEQLVAWGAKVIQAAARRSIALEEVGSRRASRATERKTKEGQSTMVVVPELGQNTEDQFTTGDSKKVDVPTSKVDVPTTSTEDCSGSAPTTAVHSLTNSRGPSEEQQGPQGKDHEESSTSTTDEDDLSYRTSGKLYREKTANPLPAAEEIELSPAPAGEEMEQERSRPALPSIWGRGTSFGQN